MTTGNVSKLTPRNARARLVVLSVLVSFELISICDVALAAGTARGEIQNRPAPVYRCPGLPCDTPNVFNISVAVHFDATPAELDVIQNFISLGSERLFDVTDGQAEIGEAFIHNNAFGTVADVHINSVANDTWWVTDTGDWKVGGGVQVSYNYISAARAPESFAHEFTHLVFDARDEYEVRGADCGPEVGDDIGHCPDAAAIAVGEGPCLMSTRADGIRSEYCWGQGDPDDLTDISGGNHDATGVTEQSRCRANRSCWDQVVWSWPDHFTMPAGAPDPAAGGAVVDPTQFVIAEDTVRVVLVLDESGTMGLESPSRMARLKVAALDFVNLAEDGTELGIVSFSTDAEPAPGGNPVPHASVDIAALDNAHRDDCRDAINNLPDPPLGWARTHIGDGLQKARDMIFAADGVTANTYIVLMTDGLVNEPDPDPVGFLNARTAELLADGIPVYVTCTGGDVGLSSQCSEIAAATEGFYVDSEDADDLPQAFADFHEKISGRQGIDSESGRLLAPTPKKVFVEQGAESVTFTLTWIDQAAIAAMTIIDPRGNPHGTLPMPQGRYARVRLPEPGEYLMVVTNLGNANSNSTYVARAYSRNQTRSLTAAVRYPSALPGEPIYVYAYPRGLGGPITHPTSGIMGTVLLPNGQTDTIELHDRGHGLDVEGDDLGGDGVFTGVYKNTRLKGPYRFHLRADMSNWTQATDRDGLHLGLMSPRFVREVRLSAAVGDPADLARKRVTINEWMASNTHTRTNPVTGSYDDWFELYNPNTVAVNLSGWSLANSLTNVTQFVVPQGRILPPLGFLLVWADLKSSATTEPDLHVNFRLSRMGETIAIFAPDGTLVDRVTFGAQTDDISQGRSPDGGPYIFSFTKPTPGGPNTDMHPPPLLATAHLSGNQVIITFNTMPGLTYRVDYKNALSASTWTQLGLAQVASSSSLSVPDTMNGRKQRFYRVVIVQ
jgi:hypothetical protein